MHNVEKRKSMEPRIIINRIGLEAPVYLWSDLGSRMSADSSLEDVVRVTPLGGIHFTDVLIERVFLQRRVYIHRLVRGPELISNVYRLVDFVISRTPNSEFPLRRETDEEKTSISPFSHEPWKNLYVVGPNGRICRSKAQLIPSS